MTHEWIVIVALVFHGNQISITEKTYHQGFDDLGEARAFMREVKEVRHQSSILMSRKYHPMLEDMLDMWEAQAKKTKGVTHAD